MTKMECLEKLAGGAISDSIAYGPVGAMAARREQILNEIAEAELEARKDDGKKKADPKGHSIAEMLGALSSHAAASLAGGAIGGLSGKGWSNGMAVGSGLSVAGKIAAAITAAIKKRRTKEEQMESDRGSVLKKLLIPGFAEYDYFKRQGRSFEENDERIKEKIKKMKNDSEKRAQDGSFGGNIWGNLSEWLEKAKSWWNNDLSQWQRSLIGAGGGALVGHGVNRLLGGKGLGGLMMGGLGGLTATTVDWNELSKALSSKKENNNKKDDEKGEK